MAICFSGSDDSSDGRGSRILSQRTVSGRTVQLVEVEMPEVAASDVGLPESMFAKPADATGGLQLRRRKYLFKLDGRAEPLHAFEYLQPKNRADDATATPSIDPMVKLLDVLITDDSNYIVLYKVRGMTHGMTVTDSVKVIPNAEKHVSDIIVGDSEMNGIVTDGSLRAGLGDALPAAHLVIDGKVQVFPLVEADGKWTWGKPTSLKADTPPGSD